MLRQLMDMKPERAEEPSEDIATPRPRLRRVDAAQSAA
jgi:hypothetical protein